MRASSDVLSGAAAGTAAVHVRAGAVHLVAEFCYLRDSAPRRLVAIIVGDATTGGCHDRRIEGWLRVREAALSHARRADVRALLPLQGLPAADRHGVRAQRADRGRPDRIAVRQPTPLRDADRQRPAAPRVPLPRLRHRGVERVWRAEDAALRPRRHARRPAGAAARRAHLYPLEAAMDHVARGRACFRRRITIRRRYGRPQASNAAERSCSGDDRRWDFLGDRASC